LIKFQRSSKNSRLKEAFMRPWRRWNSTCPSESGWTPMASTIHSSMMKRSSNYLTRSWSWRLEPSKCASLGPSYMLQAKREQKWLWRRMWRQRSIKRQIGWNNFWKSLTLSLRLQRSCLTSESNVYVLQKSCKLKTKRLSRRIKKRICKTLSSTIMRV